MNNNVRRLVESALIIALSTVLSMLKIDLPFGGGVTIVSMLPLVINSYRWGWKWGTLTSFVYSLIQLLLGLDNVGYAETTAVAVAIALLDYVLPYTLIGLASLFSRSRKGLAAGIVCTFFLRFLCHLVTGAIIWGQWMPETFMGMAMTNPWVYSFLYNGWYMLAETVLTLLVAMSAYNVLSERLMKNQELRKA